MSAFIHALFNPDVPFIRFALLAGILASPAFGMIGTYVVVKRTSYIAGAISHAALAGIGASLFLEQVLHVSWLSPLLGAVLVALLSALLIGLVTLYGKEREDTMIGTIWALGMAIGLIFMAKTPGYADPMSYLFGSILLIKQTDLLLLSVLTVLVLVVGVLFYNQFQSISFDDEFSRSRGMNSGFYHLILIFLTALTVVLLVTVVGIVMVIALLTIPAAIGGLFTKRLWPMMVLASLVCLVVTSFGLAFSFMLNLPTGPVTILLAGAFYFFALLIRKTANP